MGPNVLSTWARESTLAKRRGAMAARENRAMKNAWDEKKNTKGRIVVML